MLRRRILESIFKFTSNPNNFSFAYGIQQDPETVTEVGEYIGLHQVPVIIDGETYYKLSGTSNATIAYVDVAMYNFVTTTANQEVTFKFRSSCENPNDFLGASKLDSTDKNNLAVKLTGVTNQNYTYTVATPGSHFIKVYYYQHNDGVTSGDNAGYFKMVPFTKINYAYRYSAPDIQSFTIKSYYGWNLTSKPNWVTVGKMNNSNFTAITTDTSGTHNLKLSAQSNPGVARSGNIVLTEKYGGQSVTLPVSQAANPHPNDIILSKQKVTIPNDTNPNETINVELVGNLSYVISNVSSGLTVSPMSNNIQYSQLSINTSGINAPANNTDYTFRITGDAGTVKDIIISKEGTSLNCYCDCNTFNGCGCHSQTSFTFKKSTSAAEASCPKHDANQGPRCTGHTSCWCDCESVVLCSGECNNCPCNAKCNNCASHCDGKNCSCYGQCNNCTSDCAGNSCTCYWHSGYNSCSCYSNMVGSCNDTCGSYCDRVCQSQCPANWNCECDHGYTCNPWNGGEQIKESENSSYLGTVHKFYPSDCESVWAASKSGTGCYLDYYGCSTESCSPYRGTGYNDDNALHTSMCWSDSPSGSRNCHLHSRSCEVEISGEYCSCWKWWASCHDYWCGDGSCTSQCTSNTSCSGNNGCTCNSQCSHCAGDCGSQSTTSGTSCGSHCIGQGQTYPETCTCNRNTNTECTSQNCSKAQTCDCNQKTYYPYCDCDQYCKCDGYTVPLAN